MKKKDINNYHIAQQVKKALQELYGKRLGKLILFGSYARGEENNLSDMDFLVVLNDEKVESWREIDFIMDDIFNLEYKHNLIISPHIISKNKYENVNNLFIKQVHKDGITI